MIKWRKYLRSCPFRDKISVGNNVSGSSRRPVGTEYEEYCVPKGTPRFAGASVFYRYHIPNGMTKLIKRHFIDNLTKKFLEGYIPGEIHGFDGLSGFARIFKYFSRMTRHQIFFCYSFPPQKSVNISLISPIRVSPGNSTKKRQFAMHPGSTEILQY